MNIYNKLYKIPSVLMRGGTSRGLILRDIDLPPDSKVRDKIITKIFGSSNNGQIDGVGGGTSLTSKVAIIGITNILNCDIYYTFGQVSTNKKNIDYKVTCGNMASAVGLYAVEEGLVELTEGITVVKIYNTNTKRVMEVEVPIHKGQVVYEGDFAISGVSGTGSCIKVNFLDFGGAITGELLPTGNATDLIELGKTKEKLEVTIVDTGNIIVFIRATDIGLEGTELSDVFNKRLIKDKIEHIRIKCGQLLGLFKQDEKVTPETRALPKVAIVSESTSYKDENGEIILADQTDIVARYISMGTLHRAFAVSGAIGLGVACNIPGTIPFQLNSSGGLDNITIGHPTGTILVDVQVKKENGSYQLIRGGIGRTARRIMEGHSIVPIEFMRT